MSLTAGQKIAMVLVALNVLAGATAQLTSLFGANIASDIASVASLGGTILSGWIFIVTGQGNMVKQVADMPGVERISVNAMANQTLAQVATDPAQTKVGANTPDARATLQQTARGS